MAAQSFKVFVKKQLRLDLLPIPARNMAKLGLIGVADVKRRTASGLGPTDSPAKPLKPKWRVIKQRMGLKPIRDLRGSGFAFGQQFVRGKKRRKTGKRFVGHMLDNFQVRTASANKVRAGLSQFAARLKGAANQRREPWMVFSPRGSTRVVQEARRIFLGMKEKFVKTVAGRAA